ncbi:TRAFs-binding domain-containing protein [Rhizorhapis sp. SPR117]|uniref:TRAFs-binding domain-containing protein n=1 Tax=Rhizorhapis sp. SPR117 TaxID=2912611 RepID=UPI001F1E8EBB|nr:TRAFs-binding domain-containing protein [Rhizorhapis sp. SPR117]
MLLPIIAHARAGALDHAWRLFQQAGLDRDDDDPRALSLKGRLLKDFALRSAGKERLRFYREAAVAYQRAAEIGQASYPLINAATLSMLAGDDSKADKLATMAIDWIKANPDEPETPYYHAATIAEALLLLRREEEARATLIDAIALAPRAWEDHASTLRQFALILETQQAPAEWLDALRPPRSLHFSGHMSFSDEAANDALLAQIAEMIADEKIGFGFGALAAGADIIIAEALLEAGAEVHAILPGGVEAFAARSVDPFGSAWRKRFDVVLERAEMIRPVRPLDSLPDEAVIDTAAVIAMGLAIRHAQGLESEAIQCLVVDPDQPHTAPGASTTRAAEAWNRTGLRQRLIAAARQSILAERHAADSEENAQRAFALLAMGSRKTADDAPPPESELARLHEAVADLHPAMPPFWSGEYLILTFQHPQDAMDAGAKLSGEGWPVGGDFCVGLPVFDPFAGKQRLPAHSVAACCGACASSLDGGFQATEDLAAAIILQSPGRCIAELVGEFEPSNGEFPIPLFSLRPRL